jgi:diguanylate cyclase (GGDEF)-like protein/PAS domain S-box-containing protein
MPPFQDPDTYRDILDGLQIGVSVLDLQKKIVFWSDGAEQITGYARIEVLGHTCMDNILLHCNQTSCELCSEKCPITTALRDAQPVEAVSFIHHKSGHRIPARTWAIPLRNKHGSIIGVIQTFECEFAVNVPKVNDRSIKRHGWLDDVTGLSSQAMMQSHLRETLGTFTALHIPFGVLCVGIHELPQLRARYGQEAATSMMQVLGRTLRNTVWPTDFVGHWGDGQFLVILCGCVEDALETVVGRLLKMMSSATIMWWGEELTAAVSMGGAAAIAGDTAESLLRRTQQGMKFSRVTPAAAAAAAPAKRSTS